MNRDKRACILLQGFVERFKDPPNMCYPDFEGLELVRRGGSGGRGSLAHAHVGKLHSETYPC